MISREELSSKAELKSDEAEELEEEAVKLEEQGVPSQALRKVRQAARLHHEARILQRRAHLLLLEQIEALWPRPLSWQHYLDLRVGCQTTAECLVREFGQDYCKARPNSPGWRGRFPEDLRSGPIRHKVKLSNGEFQQVSLGQQLELICRRDTVHAALFNSVKIEQAWKNQSADAPLSRSTALMSLIGKSGYGKSTALLELVPQLRELLDKEPELALKIVEEASPEHSTRQDHDATIRRLRNSIHEGQELVSVQRLRRDNVLLLEERGLELTTVLALRTLYGFLTYLDHWGIGSSPVGTYDDFLQRFDPTMKQNLKPDDAFQFLETMTNQSEEPHTFILLIDEFHYATSMWGAEEEEATWAQKMISALLTYMEASPSHDRLVLAVLATSKHTHASLAGTKTPHASTAVLPLRVPLLSDVQHLLRNLLQRLEDNPDGLRDGAALRDPASVTIQAMSLVGANFRLLDDLLVLLGGQGSFSNWGGWDAGDLSPGCHVCTGPASFHGFKEHISKASALEPDCELRAHCAGTLAASLALGPVPATSSQPRNPLCGVLCYLQQDITRSGYLLRILGVERLLGSGDTPAKRAVLEQVAAHALVGKCVRLADEVSGVPGMKWADLFDDGLFHVLFAEDSDEHARPGVQEQPEAQLHSPDGDAQMRPVTMPPPSSVAHSALEKEPNTPPPASTVQLRSPTGSSALSIATISGSRRCSAPTRDHSQERVTVQLCPMMLGLLWESLYLSYQVPAAQLRYEDTTYKKEQVDLISILFPLFLRRRYLKEQLCALSNVLRGRYMLPELARLEVKIPETGPRMWPVHVVEQQLTPEVYGQCMTDGEMALGCNDGLSAFAFSGARIYGAASLITLLLHDAPVTYLRILIRSEPFNRIDTNSLKDVLDEMREDFSRHGISTGPGEARVPCLKGLDHGRSMSASGSQQQAASALRQGADAGGCPGGSMEDFVEEVLTQKDLNILQHWESQLVSASLAELEARREVVVYCFVADLPMEPEDYARHRVLALAGHWCASRLVLMDKDRHNSFYGVANALQRSIGHLVSMR